MTCIASIFQSISIDFCLYFRIILYGRNDDQYRAILYSTNGLGEYGDGVIRLVIVVKKNEYVHCICGCIYMYFVAVCLEITVQYCTVQYVYRLAMTVYKIPIV